MGHTFGVGNQRATVTNEMDTPETDKAERMAYAGEYMVPTEVARRLERERDEARVMMSEFQRIRSNYCDEQLRLVFENRRLHQERDEAIRQRDETNKSSKYACDYNYEQKLKAERERDEALELAQQMSESNQVLMADTRFYRNAWQQLKEIAK